ncbi:hypothetical protein Pan44_53640 [Caulifigura coniformis]|uniref:Phospholipase D-like domain-containing protein n=1 Tax=Caulifigura coniformis TaxID=2527983 RepID=A0A517SMH3_9PLAN|nr:hypothetical protein [Caulifigura coniformis]QDT57296.1 hypothetical protein Pan44_53640 [Caulifigura coniformis]
MTEIRHGVGKSVFDSAAERYHRALRSLRESGDSDSVICRFPWQTKVAFQELLQLAIDTQKRSRGVVVRVLTGSFCSEVYGPPVAEKFEQFLAAGGDVRIIVWNDSYAKSEWLIRSLERQGKLECRISGTTENGEKLSHLFVVGKDAYRLESPHPAYRELKVTDSEPEILSRICFSDSKGAAILAKYFDDLWRLCEVRSRLEEATT